MDPFELLTIALRQLVEQQIDAALTRRGFAPVLHSNSRSEAARRTLGSPERQAWLAQIAAVVISHSAEAFGVTVEQVLGRSRPQPIASARHVSIFILRADYGFRHAEAARAVKRRDHTSSSHAQRKVRARIGTEEHFATKVQSIRKAIAADLRDSSLA